VRSEATTADICSGTRIASARYGNAQAMLRVGAPVQFQLSVFWTCYRAASPTGSAIGDLKKRAVLQIAR
jgi:hypothetical protein